MLPVGPLGGAAAACTQATACICRQTGVTLGSPGGPWKQPCNGATTNIPQADLSTVSMMDQITWSATSTVDIGAQPAIPPYFPHSNPEAFFLQITSIGEAMPPIRDEVQVYRAIPSFTSTGGASISGGTVSYFTP